jgi:hypothetical protein
MKMSPFLPACEERANVIAGTLSNSAGSCQTSRLEENHRKKVLGFETHEHIADEWKKEGKLLASLFTLNF